MPSIFADGKQTMRYDSFSTPAESRSSIDEYVNNAIADMRETLNAEIYEHIDSVVADTNLYIDNKAAMLCDLIESIDDDIGDLVKEYNSNFDTIEVALFSLHAHTIGFRITNFINPKVVYNTHKIVSSMGYTVPLAMVLDDRSEMDMDYYDALVEAGYRVPLRVKLICKYNNWKHSRNI